MAIAPGEHHTGEGEKPDAILAGLAARQHGVVARRQLLAAGLSVRAVEHRVATGRLHRVHRGVFAVGHPVLSQRGRWMAGVLAAGAGAVLSHRAAAALHGVRPWSGGSEVTTPTWRAQRPGLIVHAATIPPDERTVLDGIPVTGLSRTLFDLAAVEAPQYVERAFREAHFLRLTDTLGVPALLERHPGRPGAQVLRTAVAHAADGRLLSDGEADLMAFLDAHRLPRPFTNVHVEGWLVDAWWPRQRVVAELDGWQAHRSRAAFERDRRKATALQAAGIALVPITVRRLRHDAAALAADLRRVLGI